MSSSFWLCQNIPYLLCFIPVVYAQKSSTTPPVQTRGCFTYATTANTSLLSLMCTRHGSSASLIESLKRYRAKGENSVATTLDTLKLVSNSIQAINRNLFHEFVFRALELVDNYVVNFTADALADQALTLQEFTYSQTYSIDRGRILKHWPYPVFVHPLLNMARMTVKSPNLRYVNHSICLGCSNLQYLTFSGHKLDYVSPDWSQGFAQTLKSLALQARAHFGIGGKILKNFKELKNLDLSLKDHTNIDRSYFEHLGDLKRLRFVGSDIKTLDNGIFDHLKQLEELDLSANKIQTLGNVLQNLFLLRALDISFNMITELTIENFKTSTGLNFLDASVNEISRIEAQALSQMSKLKKLNLKLNPVIRLDPMMLEGLASLEELVISETDIKTIEVATFEKMTNLKKLYMAYNELTELNSKIFKGQEHLEYLDVKGNELGDDSFDAFEGLNQLQILNVSSNRFTVLNGLTLSTLKSLSLLEISSKILLSS